VQISALSWTHGGSANYFSDLVQIDVSGIFELATGANPMWPCLVIAFSAPVTVPGGPVTTPLSGALPHIFEVTMDPNSESDSENGFRNPCPVIGGVIPVTATLSPANPQLIVSAAPILPSPATASALAFLIDLSRPMFSPPEFPFKAAVDIWVRLRGDFLLDTGTPQRAISAEFVRGELPTGEQPSGSGLCLEGGTFESWLTLFVGYGEAFHPRITPEAGGTPTNG
jgi:hypothetical protein